MIVDIIYQEKHALIIPLQENYCDLRYYYVYVLSFTIIIIDNSCR